MQKTLSVLLFATALILTSCSQPAADNSNTKHDHNTAAALDSTDVVPLDSANVWIRNYHRALGSADQPMIGLSFMLDANVLREYLQEHAEVAKLDVYLAKPNDTTITVVYIPAVAETLGDSVVYKENPVTVPGLPGEYALDHALPCPVCVDRIKIPGSEANPNSKQ